MKRQAQLSQLDVQEQEQEMILAAGGKDRLGKRRRIHAKQQETRITSTVSSSDSAQVNALWQQMKDQANLQNEWQAKQDEMVKVVQTYKFAGQVSTTEKLLPASHPEAIAYLKEKVPCSKLALSKPGPRKKKASSLASLSAAATAKPTSINTLEKSKMDWESFKRHTLGESEKAEIEAQTKGGGSGLGSMKGYLERSDFLQRVERRLQEGGR